MRIIFLSACLLFSINAVAQDKRRSNDTVIKEVVYDYVEQMPVAGYDYVEFFAKNFHYPDSALNKGFVVRVIVKFIVNEDGTISDCEVVKGREIGEEILIVMHKMPKWKPGMQNGKTVKVRYTLPITFNL